MEYALLFVVSILAGALNAVAGGGSFFTFPMLLFTGMPPVMANATNTMAIWPGTVASVAAYRKEIIANKHHLKSLMTSSFLGGLIGSLVLLATPDRTFAALIPYLLLFATLLFTFSKRITSYLRTHTSLHLNATGAFLVQMSIGFYGGYFGGGMGIMMLAMLAMMGLTHVHEMNALKSTLGAAINGITVVVFILAGIIAWPQALLMMAGTIVGGYAGAHYAKQLAPERVRGFVIIVGFLMTAYFFARG